MSKKCQFCGADLPDDALFCMRCGEQVRAGGDFSAFGGLSAPGAETAPVEVLESETQEETMSAAESETPVSAGNPAESETPASAESLPESETPAENVDSAGIMAPAAEENSRPAAADSGDSRPKGPGKFAFFRVGASLFALLLAALLSMQKVARIGWMGIFTDLKTLGFLNMGSQTSSAYVKILLLFASAGLVAGSCILFARGFAGAIRFFREGKPFPAEKYVACAFSVWVGYLVFLSACGPNYAPGPAAVGMLVVFCVVLAGFLAREFYRKRKQISAAPGNFLLQAALFVCAALMFGLFGGSYIFASGIGVPFVTMITAAQNVSEVALPLILMLGAIAVLSLGAVIFARLLENLLDGKNRSVLGLSVAFLCVGILLPIATAIILKEPLAIAGAYVVMLVFAAGVVALSAVLRARKKGENEQLEEQEEFDTSLFERWKGIDRVSGDIFKIVSATFGLIVILVLFFQQFLPMYPADGKLVNVIDYFVYATGQPLNVTMVNALSLIGVAGANLVTCGVVLILAIVRGIKMLSSGKCGDMSGLVATSLGIWLVTQGLFASGGQSLGNAFSVALGLSVAALVAARIVRYLTDAEARTGEALAKSCADTVSVSLITLWFQSHVYLRSLSYWETNTTWFSVLTVLLMLSAAVLGVVGGVLWCRAVRAAVGVKRNRRLGLIVACTVLSVCGFLFYGILMAQLKTVFLFGSLFVPGLAIAAVVWETKFPAFRGPKINSEE